MKLKKHLLSTILISLFLCKVNSSVAQPCNNISTIGSCSEVWNVSLSGAGTWNTKPCVYGTPGNELIFQYTPTVSGIHSIDITSMTGFDIIDLGWKLASSGCSQTGWTCIDDLISNGTYGSMNWTAGVTYYIIVDVEGTSGVTFSLQLNCPSVSTEASDCSEAVPICSDANFSIDPNGHGLINEIPSPSINSTSNPSFMDGQNTALAGSGAGCLLSGETNSTWMVINVLAGGTLEFSFGAYNTSGNYFDWAMWPYSASACANIIADNLAPIRCNYNGEAVSFTGIASATNLTNMENTNSDPGLSDNFAPEVIAGSNTQYLICFSNWSSAQTTVPLNFFGTAQISCTTLGNFDIDISGSREEEKNIINWYVANEIDVVNYSIERRLESGEWIVLGTQDPSENGGSLKQYTHTDETPIRGQNYYRIKQYRKDGSVKESAIISIEQKIEGLSILSAFPNPANNQLNVKYTTREAGNVELQIVNLVGRIVYTENMNAGAGVSINTIDVSQIASGSYLIQLTNKVTDEKQIVRFIKE